MKINKKSGLAYLPALILAISFLASCKKENSAQTAGATQSVVAASTAVAVSADSSSNDSIYVVGTCADGHHLDSVPLSGLPTGVTAYLTANYAGYTFQKAYADKDAAGNVTGYAVIIQYNGKPVGLKFDASGNFLRVLEQREGHDLSGRGWHEGGRFNNRDGRHRDTIALSSLPDAITAYFSANYAQDTLVKAIRNRDSSYLVFSKNDGAYVTLFDANGVFIKRVSVADHETNVTVIAENALPAAVQSYLSTTYPNYVFTQAFSVSQNGVLAGYVVSIDANGTKYAIGFDGAGTFIKAITIR